MFLFKKSVQLKPFLHQKKIEGSKIGFVPTMGALHRGHISLIEKAKQECEIVVCSIFVNPTQFNDKKDLEKYPRPIEHDMEMLLQSGCDVLYLPDATDMYHEGEPKLKHYELGYLDKVLDAAFRPGHFQGVANVVFRLLSKVEPDKIFLGRKDFQQVQIIRRMMELEKISTQIIECDTVREASGLAMSSRNVRLSEEAWNNAAMISEILFYLKKRKNDFHSASALRKEGIRRLQLIPDSKLEYLEICDAQTLQPMELLVEGKPSVALVAIVVDGVRLIDNIMI